MNISELILEEQPDEFFLRQYDSWGRFAAEPQINESCIVMIKP